MDLKQEAFNYLESQQPIMIDLLIKWSKINSGTFNFAGLKTMCEAVIAEFNQLGGELELITPEKYSEIDLDGKCTDYSLGNMISIKKRPDAKFKILFTGHMDTVFELDHTFQDVTWLDDNTLNGPGVTDMKGGLIVMLNALLVFEKYNSDLDLGWEIVINADEEIGSCGSKQYLESIASQYDVGLIYEPSMNEKGDVASIRKGSGKFIFIAKGKSAHAGRDFHQGRNAICYLAEFIVQLNKLNGQRDDLTINVGQIAGGEALNQVPSQAVVKIDVRYQNSDDEDWFFAEVENLVAEFTKRADYSLEMHGEFGRPPKVITPELEKLYELVRSSAEELDLDLGWVPSGGCCDGNNLARAGLPVIDSMGVCGGHIHQSREYIKVDSLLTRAKLSFLVLLKLAQGDYS